MQHRSERELDRRGTTPPKVAILYTTSGGGHVSCARAVGRALTDSAHEVTYIDAVKEYCPKVLQPLPQLYSLAARHPMLWRFWYFTVAGPRRAALTDAINARLTGRALKRLVAEQQADIYVSVHPAMNAPFAKGLRKTSAGHAKFVTLVTDLVTMSPIWFSKHVDLCLVPTPQARELALAQGLAPENVKVVPYPVAEKFFLGRSDGAPQQAPVTRSADGRAVVVIAGGGDGAGPIEAVVRELDRSPKPMTVQVITGTNTKLKQLLEQGTWRQDVQAFGFVPNMEEFLAGADVFLTKAGPAALLESAAAQVPCVMIHNLPGQEKGNVDHVADLGAAARAFTPREARRVTEKLIEDDAARAQMRRAQRLLTEPGATATVARAIVSVVDEPRGALPLPRLRRAALRSRRLLTAGRR